MNVRTAIVPAPRAGVGARGVLGHVAAVIRDARRRQRRRRSAVLLALLVTTLGVLVGLWRGGGATTGEGAQRLAAIRFRLEGAPVAVTATRGRVWVVVETSASSARLVALDPDSGVRVASFVMGQAGPDFGAAASRGGVVWAAAGDHVLRVDGTHVGRTRVRGEAAAIDIGYGSVWVATIGLRGYALTRLDATTLAVQARIPLTAQPIALRAGLGSLWLASTGGLWKIDAQSGRSAPAPVPVSAPPVGLALSGGRLWVIQQDRLATGVDPSGRVGASIGLPFSPGAIAASTGRLWITDDCGCARGKLALVDTRTRRVVAERPIGETPVALAGNGAGVWVATFGDASVERVAPS